MLPPITDPGALIKWWSSLYSDHTNLSNGITFLHLAGLIVGGGAAVTTDRQILKAWRAGGERRRGALEDVSAVHAFVIGGLVLTIVTGALMMLADWDTFLGSRLFWTKMTGVAILIVNGAVLGWAERLARQSSGRRGWPVLATVSTISLVMWLTVLGLGTWLKTAAS